MRRAWWRVLWHASRVGWTGSYVCSELTSRETLALVVHRFAWPPRAQFVYWDSFAALLDAFAGGGVYKMVGPMVAVLSVADAGVRPVLIYSDRCGPYVRSAPDLRN